MAARLGLISGKGLAENIKIELNKIKWLKYVALILVFSGILVGNGAYEAGNIGGAVLGMETLIGTIRVVADIEDIVFDINIWGIVIGLVSTILILRGNYKLIERSMIFLVTIMSVVFVVAAVAIKPDLSELLNGLVPSIPDGGILFVVGLIGTTVVPYNLFLHSSSVSQKWKSENDLGTARFDTFFAIAIGGIISLAIIITAASIPKGSEITSAADLAVQLEPLLGSWAETFIAIGLFSAGISSSLTAPLAASFAASGIFGFPPSFKNRWFKLVSITILFIGTAFASTGFKPIEVIKFAQAANGILLPFIAVFLVWIMNRKSLLGKYSNSYFNNILGIIVILVTLILGIKSLISL